MFASLGVVVIVVRFVVVFLWVVPVVVSCGGFLLFRFVVGVLCAVCCKCLAIMSCGCVLWLCIFASFRVFQSLVRKVKHACCGANTAPPSLVAADQG